MGGGVTPVAGDSAPDFSLLDGDDQEHRLRDYLGSYVVLFFYPKDSTPGCTLEAQQFSAQRTAFARAGAKIFGISGGSTASKAKFCDKHNIAVPLLADTDFSVCKQFGVYQKKKFMGREFMGIVRTTFLISPKGKVLERFDRVTPKGHAEQVLDALRLHAGESTSRSRSSIKTEAQTAKTRRAARKTRRQ